MSEKVTGYLLLVVGILIIGFSFFSVFSVFLGTSEPLVNFSFSGINLDLGRAMGAGEIPPGVDVPNLDLQSEILSADMLNQPMNLTFHLILMGFLANIGYKIAMLGVNLVRPVKVNLNSPKQQ